MNNSSHLYNSNLFRQEALDYFHAIKYGGPQIQGSRLTSILTLCMLALTTGLITWLFVGHISRKQTVSGELIPERGLVKIYSPMVGQVLERRVAEGQTVKAGDVLFVVGAARSTLDNINTSIEETQKKRLQIQQLEIDHQKDLEQQASKEDIVRLTERINGFRQQKNQIDGDIELQQQRVVLSQQQLDNQEPLVQQGFISPAAVSQQKAAHFQLMGEIAGLRRQRIEISRQILEATAERDAVQIRSIGRKEDYSSQKLKLDQDISELGVRTKTVVRASVNGVITALSIQLGQATDQQRAIATIRPAGDALIARLYAPSRAIGFIKPGQRVRIRYQAFPFERFGTATGVVQAVSKSIMSPQEVGTIGLTLQEATYPITVKLARQDVQAYGESWPLESGMLLEADVTMGRQSLITWILGSALEIQERL